MPACACAVNVSEMAVRAGGVFFYRSGGGKPLRQIVGGVETPEVCGDAVLVVREVLGLVFCF